MSSTRKAVAAQYLLDNPETQTPETDFKYKDCARDTCNCACTQCCCEVGLIAAQSVIGAALLSLLCATKPS